MDAFDNCRQSSLIYYIANILHYSYDTAAIAAVVGSFQEGPVSTILHQRRWNRSVLQALYYWRYLARQFSVVSILSRTLGFPLNSQTIVTLCSRFENNCRKTYTSKYSNHSQSTLNSKHQSWIVPYSGYYRKLPTTVIGDSNFLWVKYSGVVVQLLIKYAAIGFLILRGGVHPVFF